MKTAWTSHEPALGYKYVIHYTIFYSIYFILPILYFPALPDFLRSSGSGTGSTQPREYN
jgi:hypothetical protein